MRWVNSPHHILIGWKEMVQINVQADVLHYQKDDFRDRLRIERKWARALATRRMLGLSADVNEVRIHPEVHKYTSQEEWK